MLQNRRFRIHQPVRECSPFGFRAWISDGGLAGTVGVEELERARSLGSRVSHCQG